MFMYRRAFPVGSGHISVRFYVCETTRYVFPRAGEWVTQCAMGKIDQHQTTAKRNHTRTIVWMILEMYNFAGFIKQIYEVTSRMNSRTTRVKSERRLYEYFAKQTILQ